MIKAEPYVFWVDDFKLINAGTIMRYIFPEKILSTHIVFYGDEKYDDGYDINNEKLLVITLRHEKYKKEIMDFIKLNDDIVDGIFEYNGEMYLTSRCDFFRQIHSTKMSLKRKARNWIRKHNINIRMEGRHKTCNYIIMNKDDLLLFKLSYT